MMRTLCIFVIAAVTGANAFHVAHSTTRSLQLKTTADARHQATISPLFSRKTSPLHMSSTSNAAAVGDEDVDPLIVDTSEVLGRVSWLSWWAQVILSVIASVTLLFARNVTLSQQNTGTQGALASSGFVLAGVGIVSSAISIFWTWGAARLSRKFRRNPNTSRISAANLLRRACKTGCIINLVGMLATLLGAEQIVGSLAIKVLTQSGITVTSYGQMPPQLQPLDILIVQANTNTLLSHYSSLVGFLWLTRSIAKLDPPSKQGKERGKRT